MEVHDEAVNMDGGRLRKFSRISAFFPRFSILGISSLPLLVRSFWQRASLTLMLGGLQLWLEGDEVDDATEDVDEVEESEADDVVDAEEVVEFDDESGFKFVSDETAEDEVVDDDDDEEELLLLLPFVEAVEDDAAEE